MYEQVTFADGTTVLIEPDVREAFSAAEWPLVLGTLWREAKERGSTIMLCAPTTPVVIEQHSLFEEVA